MSDAHGSIRARLANHGWAVVELGPGLLERLAQPWTLVDALVGAAPELVEVQSIHAIPDGRSFASSMVDTPLHTDSQLWRGRAPEIQITACLHRASDGGESRLLDTWAWMDSLAATDRALHHDLLHGVRRIRFVFGDVYGPTAAWRAGRCVVTHSPRTPVSDPIGERLAVALAAVPPAVVRLHPGQALVLDNHRVLHGRTAFSDGRRRLLRILAWLDAPLSPEPSWANTARAIHRRLGARLHGQASALRDAFGVTEHAPLPQSTRAVLSMLCGAPPGLIARRLAVDESTLYRWREAAIVAPPPVGEDDPEACARALADLAAANLGGDD